MAYDIQNINTEIRLNNGARMTGKKIGLTSPVVQKQLGVDQPDFGILFHDKEIMNGQSISMTELMQPKVEAEIAFVLKHDLTDKNLGSVDIINAIDYALPALEIVGSRIKDWNIKITDTVADNASASHYVLGHSPTRLIECDVVSCQMEMFKNNDAASSGNGSACLGSPINATIWLANKMVEMGNPLKAGEVIFTGALGPMVTVEAGDLITAYFEGIGSVSVNFTK
ncbi:UNVERIFIED_CONTAM: hypothetical protein GTU68_065551 [Idotea baltica]|nr:hypothetical protein [Idotea baltica]